MKFQLLDKKDLTMYSANVRDSHKNRIISGDGNIWIVKNTTDRAILARELLGYLLGEKLSNVAEVRAINNQEENDIRNLLKLDDSIINLYLVRHGENYKDRELKCVTLEKAVATELIYSTWIRRRDTHSDNRVYLTNGIPIFYDHHVAFLYEDPRVKDIDYFFIDRSRQHFHGSASWWRVVETDKIITTIYSRNVKDIHERAHHYVNDINLFKKELNISFQVFRSMYSSSEIIQVVVVAGFESAKIDEISSFLIEGLKTLETDIEKMKEVIFSPLLSGI